MFTPTESWQDKQSFILSALGRLENGVHCYTTSSHDRLLHIGWLIEDQQKAYFPEVEKSYHYALHDAVLYDFYTDPMISIPTPAHMSKACTKII
jgi:hypothetical protein